MLSPVLYSEAYRLKTQIFTFPFVLCGRATLSVTLGKDHKTTHPRDTGNKGDIWAKLQKAGERSRKLHDEDLHQLSFHSIFSGD